MQSPLPTKKIIHLTSYILILWPTHCYLKVTKLVKALDNKDILVENNSTILDKNLQSGNVSTMLHR